MIWSSMKVKRIWFLFCIVWIITMSVAAYLLGQLLDAWPALIFIGLLSLIGLCPKEQQAKAGITKESIKSEFDIADIRSEKGIICENTIVNGDKVFKLLDTNGGYTNKSIRKMIIRHQYELQHKSIVIRIEPPSLGNGVAFNTYGLYVETNELLRKTK